MSDTSLTRSDFAFDETRNRDELRSAQSRFEPARIPGWGVDANPENDPTYPMRDMSKDDKGGMNWPRPTLQPATVEVLHSNERPSLSAVFGTSTPPRGLSGMLRRQAFKYSEGKWTHWLFLLFADRINVVEGIFQDLARFRFPNVFGEMGARAEWRHNRSGFFRKLAIAFFIFAVLLGIILLIVS